MTSAVSVASEPASGGPSKAESLNSNVQEDCEEFPESWRGALRIVRVELSDGEVIEQYQPLEKRLQELREELCMDNSGYQWLAFVAGVAAPPSARLGSFGGGLLSPLHLVFQTTMDGSSTPVMDCCDCVGYVTSPLFDDPAADLQEQIAVQASLERDEVFKHVCQVCDAVLQTNDDADRHRLLDKHWCSHCQVQVSGAHNWQLHIAGKLHIRRSVCG